MRKLVDADSEKHARQLVDRLLVEGIDAQARPDGGTEVWVIDEDELDAARALIEAPPGADAAGVASRAEAIRKDKDREDGDHAQRFVDMNTRWKGVSVRGVGLVTAFLIGGSVIVALVGFLGDADLDPMGSLAIDHWSSPPGSLARVRAGEVWRLLTPMFLHFGIFHLAFNMMWMYSLGRQIEANHGSGLFVVLVVVSELAGNLGQYAVSGPNFGGMSGVVYACFGFVWMNARYNRRYQYAISGGNTVLIMGWFVLCATGFVGPIANIGHAGGLVVGLLFGMPSFIRHVRAKGTSPDLVEGGWADVNLTGFRRFRRLWLARFAPLWFLAIAAAVIALEHA